MTLPVVLDTNVLLVANQQHADVSAACVGACVKRLCGIQASGCVLLDDGYEILGEYQNKTQPNVGKGVGDVFLKQLLRNAVRNVKLPLVRHAQRGFESFPSDVALKAFDPADRKFVAVAAAHAPRAPILQAADSKWLVWAAALRTHQIAVEFLCPEDLSRFAKAKASRKTPTSGRRLAM